MPCAAPRAWSALVTTTVFGTNCHTQRCRLALVKRTEQVSVIWQNQAGPSGDQEVPMGGQREGRALGHGQD
jgi:hypothetical protein